MRSSAAVCVDNDLASGQASIAIGAADFKAASRVDVIFGFGQQACRKQVGNNALHIIVQFRFFFALIVSRCMLRGDDDSGGGFRFAFAVVAQGNLAFRIGFKERRSAGMTVGSHAFQNLVAVIERRRHQVRSLRRRIAEHDSLVASTFVLVASGVNALCDMRRLAMKVIFEAQGFPMEALLRIPDFLDCAADGRFDFFLGARGPFAIFVDALAADFASEHDQLRCGQCFAGDARLGVFG